MKAQAVAPEFVELDARLAAGGEAVIWSIANRADSVAKIYLSAPTECRTRKLRAMLDAPPPDPTAGQGHTAICWPQSLLYDDHRQRVGFLMPRLNGAHHKPVFHFYNQLSRRQVAPDATWEFLVQVAANTASVVATLHSAGYVIGDVNESNFMVSDRALVALVDCDSIQVPSPGGGQAFRCLVGKPEYLAPELHGCNLATIDRTVEQDRFSLGVLVFQLLMEGLHPYAGVWQGPGDPSLAERIERGETPYAPKTHIAPSPWALPLTMLPDTVRALVTRCFQEGHVNPARRPSAAEWHRALKALGASLTSCSRHRSHRYSAHLAECIWCQSMRILGAEDHFPGRGGSQASVPHPAPRMPLSLSTAPTAGVLPATPRPPESSVRRPVSGWTTLLRAVGVGALLGLTGIAYAGAWVLDLFGLHAVSKLNVTVLCILAVVGLLKLVGYTRR